MLICMLLADFCTASVLFPVPSYFDMPAGGAASKEGQRMFPMKHAVSPPLFLVL